jgi:DNA adenine methylase
MTVTRPVLRYHGGKFLLARWVISHFPEHRIYVEPYGGAASVLMQKERCYAEVYNELDPEIVNVFAVLREPSQAKQLEEQLRLTPFARDEFFEAYDFACAHKIGIPIRCVECARKTVIKSFMGFGSDSINNKSGFRATSNRSGTTPAHDWANYWDALPMMTARLSGVVIERRLALHVMQQHDTVKTLHYVDPPYVHKTRQSAKRYRHELSDEQHVELALFLHGLKGFVVLSGYNCDHYERLYFDWKRIDKRALADGARERVESLWLNPQAVAAIDY